MTSDNHKCIFVSIPGEFGKRCMTCGKREVPGYKTLDYPMGGESVELPAFTIDEYARRHAQLLFELEQMTKRRNEAAVRTEKMREEKYELQHEIQVLKKRLGLYEGDENIS